MIRSWMQFLYRKEYKIRIIVILISNWPVANHKISMQSLCDIESVNMQSETGEESWLRQL